MFNNIYKYKNNLLLDFYFKKFFILKILTIFKFISLKYKTFYIEYFFFSFKKCTNISKIVNSIFSKNINSIFTIIITLCFLFLLFNFINYFL